MTVLLIANIGNRDMWVDKAAPIPGKVNPQWNKDASRRALGKAIQADWPNCQPHLKLPIIGKAVRYIQQQAGQLDRVVLVSSDQSGQAGVADYHLAQDTCELAPVVERLLIKQYGLPAKAITHQTVMSNPADYGGMQAFFREQLTALRDDYPGATFYLQVSGGTPAMTSMLLTVGVDVLGIDAHPLYVTKREEQPFPLDLGRRLVADSLIETIKANLDIYAYHAAANTVRDNRDLLREFIPADPLLTVLEYAKQRVNFNFKDAGEIAVSAVDLAYGDKLHAIAANVQNPTPTMLLRESISSTQLAYAVGNMFDFVVRVFQFVEGAWRNLALELDVQFEHNGKPNPYGKELAPAWVQKHQSIVERLERDGVRLKKVNRFVLEKLVTVLHEQVEDKRYQGALDVLEKLEAVGDLRNRVVHQYHHITLELLRNTYYPKKKDQKRHPPEDAIDIVDAMKTVWSIAAGRPFKETNPYNVINDLIREILCSPKLSRL
ncbi:MAG TPA: hypothetical protein G4N99_11385 [Thermoflexia bacterium]|nr:hypothetical protein [Thermoflexia bacterium]